MSTTLWQTPAWIKQTFGWGVVHTLGIADRQASSPSMVMCLFPTDTSPENGENIKNRREDLWRRARMELI